LSRTQISALQNVFTCFSIAPKLVITTGGAGETSRGICQHSQESVISNEKMSGL
jgi:hypothetical protein